MTKSSGIVGDWRALVAQVPSEWRLSEEFLASIPSSGRLIENDVVRRSGILTDHELDITENYPAAGLLQRLAQGEISSLETTTAFCKRSAIANQLV
jgi:amidase